MKLDYTTDYVLEGSGGVPYNTEIETTFDVTPGRYSLEYPPEGPEINDLTVKVLHIDGLADTEGLYEKVAEAITDELWESIGIGRNIILLESVYDDADERMFDHA